MTRRDPVERAADDSEDLYDVATWEPRSRLDVMAIRIHAFLHSATRALLVLSAIVILLAIVGGGLGALLVEEPLVLLLSVLSAVPALLLALYVWHIDVTTDEPLTLLVPTFLLGVLFLGFAAILNSTGADLLSYGTEQPSLTVSGLLFFYVVVGPIEEGVKLLAVRLYAFRSDRFDAVIDGAVYGAVAGLGFATFENLLYIAGSLDAPTGGVSAVTAAGLTAIVRLMAGPGHVIYTAIAGYYLGLAKFNPDDAGPLVVKGLLIAALLHGTYNVTVGFVPDLISSWLSIGIGAAFVLFIVVYDGLAGLYLYRKLQRYRRTYEAVDAGPVGEDLSPEMTEYEP